MAPGRAGCPRRRWSPLRIRLSAKATSSGMPGRDGGRPSACRDARRRVDGVGPGRVGRGRNDVGQAADLDDVGRVAAGAFSVWKAWIVRPLMAPASVASTKPDSFSVSVWIITCTSIASATAGSIVDGGRRGAPVLVQLRRAGAASTCSTSAAGSRGIALAGEAGFIGTRRPPPSCAQMPRAGVQVVASVPCAGPVPPPSRVVTPESAPRRSAAGR